MAVLLVHVKEDKTLIDAIQAWLEDKGVPVEPWLLDNYDSLLDGIHETARPSDRLVIALSPAAVASWWVRREVAGGALWELARTRGLGDGFVVSALVRPCEVSIWLRGRMAANFANKPFEAACAELCEAVTAERSARPPDNRVFRTWEVAPLGKGKHAVVMEFGVCMQRAQGLHVEVDMGTPYTTTKDWFGPPNVPNVPARPGGPFFNSSLRREPPLYVRRFGEPEVTPAQSYYLYVEAEEPIRVQQRLFADSYGREV